MLTKTRSGLLVPVLIAVLVAVVAIPQLRNQVLGLLGRAGGGTELVGDGDTQFMVAESAAAEVHKCAPQQELADEQCDDLKFVIIDA